MEMLFSIIVPVYNIENYIGECVDSLIAQEGNDYEIILVDDGSTDNSGAICDNYSEKYECVKVYHKSNGGLSDARNQGVTRACGKYILFIDGDDYVTRDALKNCRKVICESKKNDVVLDLIIAEGQYYDRDSIIELQKWFCIDDVRRNKEYINGEEMLKYTLPRHCNWAAWGKYIRRDYWNQNGYSFKQGRYSEDMEFIDRVVLMAEYVSMIPSFVYYRYREGSIVHSPKLCNIQSIVDNLTGWEAFFEENDIKKEIEEGIRYYLASSYLHAALAYVYLVPEKDNKEAVQLVKSKVGWLKYNRDAEGVISFLMCKAIGVNNTCKILATIKKIRRK